MTRLVEQPNVRLAKRLLPLYAGAESAFSALARYVYYATVLQDRDDHLFSRLVTEQLAQTQMLAALLYQLGYDPKYRIVVEGDPLFWSGSFVLYPKETVAALNANITADITLQQAYENAARNIPDRKVTSLLKRFAAEKKEHSVLLTKLLEKQKRTP